MVDFKRSFSIFILIVFYCSIIMFPRYSYAQMSSKEQQAQYNEALRKEAARTQIIGEETASPIIIPSVDSIYIRIGDRGIGVFVPVTGKFSIPMFTTPEGVKYEAIEGTFSVKGKSIDDLAKAIREKVKTGEKVTVTLNTVRAPGIAVLGAFRNPTFLQAEKISLYQAISYAGDISENSNGKLSLYRPGLGWYDGMVWQQQPTVFYYKDFFRGNEWQDQFLLSGDILTSGAERTSAFFTFLNKIANPVYMTLSATLVYTQLKKMD